MRAEGPVARHAYAYHAVVVGVTLERVVRRRNERLMVRERLAVAAPVRGDALNEFAVELRR